MTQTEGATLIAAVAKAAQEPAWRRKPATTGAAMLGMDERQALAWERDYAEALRQERTEPDDNGN